MGREDKQFVELGLLDFLFTAAITVGLFPALIGAEIQEVSGDGAPKVNTGLFGQPWVQELRLPDAGEWPFFLTFMIGFFTLTFSWHGYHASLQTNPLAPNIWGMFRLTIDAVLVILYAAMMVAARSILAVAWLAALVHLLYLIWDILKHAQDPKKARERRRDIGERHGGGALWVRSHARAVVSFVSALAAVVLAVLVQWQLLNEWLSIGFAYLVVVGYRIGKQNVEKWMKANLS